MIAHLRGAVAEQTLAKDVFTIVVDVQGVGYEVHLSKAMEGRITTGQKINLFISESVTAFDGATTLYGFLTREEKELFLRIRENVDGMGPKKAMECMEKISKSLPDFKRAVIDGDLRLLVSVFGFTKKTAEKLVFALKAQAAQWPVSGQVKWAESPVASEEKDAVSGLLNLGYGEEEARSLIATVKARATEGATAETLLQEALRAKGAAR